MIKSYSVVGNSIGGKTAESVAPAPGKWLVHLGSCRDTRSSGSFLCRVERGYSSTTLLEGPGIILSEEG